MLYFYLNNFYSVWNYLDWLSANIPADIAGLVAAIFIGSWLVWQLQRGFSLNLECPKCRLDRLTRIRRNWFWRLFRSTEAYECIDCEHRFIQIHTH